MSVPGRNFGAHCVVVGASGALGKAIVAGLVARKMHVVAVARSREPLEALVDRHGAGVVMPVVADFASDDAVDALRARLDRPVAMVVHAPGVPVAGGIRAAPTDALVEACNIKVGGFVRLVRAVEDRLRRHSRLVAIGGHYGFEPTAYAATAGVANAALANVVRQMSWAYGGEGITAHLVAPGPADTDRLHKVAAARASENGGSVADELDAMRGESAIGALTTPSQVAWAVAMLLDAEADAMAGAAIMLDAGRRRGLP
ncbi:MULTISPECIES: SDR family oxidoreductase [unclassified Sphingobium]|uniref:SDR family oxidoreductase n=1 Tax=unclassified Sphingobium TaxID=2611147 RepID=UPI0005CBFF98|nr:MULTISPECIES: SDR family oxidoreductase [unclassified Sphingobium]AJR23846.1 short-chain dehydrogenase [Sphingobium sp. YBL2]MCB4862181.1 SDR family oxidoreductase [Sphingobium sp. PNB]